MFSKSLNQYSVDGWGCVPSLLFTWGQTVVDFPCGSAGKESACNVGDLGSIPGLGRSPRERKGYPLQYSGLKSPVDYSPQGRKESETTERVSNYGGGSEDNSNLQKVPCRHCYIQCSCQPCSRPPPTPPPETPGHLQVSLDQSLVGSLLLSSGSWSTQGSVCTLPESISRVAVTSAHSASKRSYPTSKVRVRSQEDPMPEGRWPRGVTPRLRSGVAAKSARLQRGRNSRGELPHV